MKFTFKCEPDDNEINCSDLNYPTVTYEVEATGLYDVIEGFECFLRGSGFHFDGSLEIVSGDEYPEYDDCCEDCSQCEECGKLDKEEEE